MHEDTEAGEQLRQAIAIVSESEGENHPDLGRYIGDLAALYDGKASMAPRFRFIAGASKLTTTYSAAS